eukprot:78977-Prorocentrum_minimum.AAC.1
MVVGCRNTLWLPRTCRTASPPGRSECITCLHCHGLPAPQAPAPHHTPPRKGGVAGELAEHVLAEHQTEPARRPRQLPEVLPRVPEEHVREPPQVDGHVKLGTPGTDTPCQTREKGTW